MTKIDILNNGGIVKTIKREGKGDTPTKGCKVKVHYTGTLKSNGKKFDSSKDRNEPFEFSLGKKEVISGWDIGVKTMKRGEISVFELAPQYAYGESGSPPSIPANADLVFEIELIDWDDSEEEPIKKILTEGTGDCCPIEGSKIVVSYSISYEGKEFEKKENFKTFVGDGDLFTELENQIQEMRKGEVSEIVFKNKFAYTKEDLENVHKVKVDDGKKIIMIAKVKLEDFEELKFDHEYEPKEKIQRCLDLKNQGNEFFKVNNFEKAKKRYEKVISLLRDKDDFKELKERDGLYATVSFNLSAIKLSEKDFSEVIRLSNQGLAIEEKNVKGLYRRGKAYFALKNYEESVKDFKLALSLNPKNKVLVKELENAKTALKKDLESESEVFGRMFE